MLLKDLLKEFNITEIEDVKITHIKFYIKFLQKQGRKTTYINGIIKCFRAFFKYAIEEEIIENNPMAKVNWLREGKVIINTFNDDEVDRMMKAYVSSDYMCIRNIEVNEFNIINSALTYKLETLEEKIEGYKNSEDKRLKEFIPKK